MSQHTVYQIYRRLLRCYGPQDWWPGDSVFEIMIGAILTQNTSWVNVERAIANLRQAGILSADGLARVSLPRLARQLTPAGYFNLKATRLKNYVAWFRAEGGLRRLQGRSTPALRSALLSINGIGPETADAMLLYAFQRPVFVVDAYTRRVFSRLGMMDQDLTYEAVRAWFEARLARVRDKQAVFNEYHALIVQHAKTTCRSKPLCQLCCLRRSCKMRLDR